jgi:hypothetical protein
MLAPNIYHTKVHTLCKDTVHTQQVAHPRVRAVDADGPAGSRIKLLILPVVPEAHILTHAIGAAISKLTPASTTTGSSVGQRMHPLWLAVALSVSRNGCACRPTCWRMPALWRRLWRSTSAPA